MSGSGGAKAGTYCAMPQQLSVPNPKPFATHLRRCVLQNVAAPDGEWQGTRAAIHGGQVVTASGRQGGRVVEWWGVEASTWTQQRPDDGIMSSADLAAS